MAVQVEQLGRAFSAETEHQFTVWTLATPDALEAVLAPGYFARCFSRFRLGDLLVCATGQPPPRTALCPSGPAGASEQGQGRRRRCMLMVTRLEPGAVEVRMVQDWGDPAAQPATTEQPPAATRTPRRRLSLAERAGVSRRRVAAVLP